LHLLLKAIQESKLMFKVDGLEVRKGGLPPLKGR
jgi:hypothetical protein